MLVQLGIRSPLATGPITEVIVMQEDIRFVAANSFMPLNKLSQIVI